MIRIIVIVASLTAASALADEVSLFNTKGEAVAYINTVKRDTIFLWSGEPVAYVSGDSLYGFNGAHLGWLERGLLWNHAGEAIGYTEAAMQSLPAILRNKGERQPIPTKLMQDVAPLKPQFQSIQSASMLENWLAGGKSN